LGLRGNGDGVGDGEAQLAAPSQELLLQARAQALLDRMVAFGTHASVLARGVRSEVGGDHIAKQLVRSATSAAANYAEACDAESRADFVHKLRIALKELRETSVWLRMIHGLNPSAEREALIKESHELIAIFVASARTAQAGIANPDPQSQSSTPIRKSRLTNRRSGNR